ncbi:MAG: prepilin-type N-terminal cleavage/methylation domain-containing protein [Myxococcales bacterium FL481]|nr:MAG: prepilin-type N-terminal cleavage/methylation domain-containing protein [Myxococcales bacterium FL481]
MAARNGLGMPRRAWPRPPSGGKTRCLSPVVGSRGFTLIELMMAMMVSVIVLAGVFAFSSIQQGTAAVHHRQVRVNQALEGAMWSVGRDVRVAGLGFARVCTELRIWDGASDRLVNPGAVGSDVGNAVTDAITGEPYWVLRDGFQAHWRSTLDGQTIDGSQGTSASQTSSADSFDVVLGERNFTNASGVFRLALNPPTTSAADAVLTVGSADDADVLDSTDADDLAAVRQLFPPGSFVLLARGDDPTTTTAVGQCVLLQVTAEIGAGATFNQWTVPIGNASGFNADLAATIAGGPAGQADWEAGPAGADATAGTMVIPLGRLRWSRYEILYGNAGRPYLVRSDFIGWLDGDPSVSPASGMEYTDCPAGVCPLPQLYLPGADTIPTTAIAPMIEDMQVAVGCDGWVAAAGGIPVDPDANEDSDFAERGDADGVANHRVDEITTDRGNDEWVGNASAEAWAPDCVFMGTGETHAAAWPVSGPSLEREAAPGFRLSPQVARITLLAKSEVVSVADDDPSSAPQYNTLYPIEDRPESATIAGAREYFTLSEQFRLRNSRWRDPAVP